MLTEATCWWISIITYDFLSIVTMFAWNDLIAAVASPRGAALRGILRLSGTETLSILEPWLILPAGEIWSARSARRLPVEVPLSGFRRPVTAAVQWWPTSRSYTGQPLAELHLPGAVPLMEAAFSEALRRGARAAQPGEFTLRAFLAGRMDLLQAEAVLGVIDAQDQRSLQTALEQLAGGISQRMVALRHDLLELLADLEAGLDFVEEHLEFVGRDDVQRRIGAALEFVEQLWQQSQQRMHAGERPRVVLAGLPNAGKSTLFNALAGQDRALVSGIAGTTRDYLTAGFSEDGLDIELVDTAGWEDKQTLIDQAMQLARSDQLSRADVVLWCRPADISESDQQIETACLQTFAGMRHPLLVITKADLASGQPATGDSPNTASSVLQISAASGQGLPQLRQQIRERLLHNSSDAAWVGSSAVRCQESLRQAVFALREAAMLAAHPGSGDELLAGELRLALDQLGTVVGAVYTDDLLDRIFSKFCIGK